jgi:hypothetical protein
MTDSENFNINQTEITEGTNMMVDYLVNSEKLINPDERWSYTKNNHNNHNDHNDNDDIDDDFNSYKHNNRSDSDRDDSRRTDRDDSRRTNRDESRYSDRDESRRSDRDDSRRSDRDERDESRHTDRDDNQNEHPKEKNSTDKYIDDEYEELPPLEKRLRKLELMRRLGELRDIGCKVTNYSIDDDYYMMKYELELHTSIRSKRNWMGLYNHVLIGCVKGVELLNNSYNPFDFSLKGLSNEVSSDKNTYYEILGEIYEHHNVPGKKMNPWFRLFITLIGTTVVVGGKNNAHKFIPGEASNVENDQGLLNMLRSKAMGAMGGMGKTQDTAPTQSAPKEEAKNGLDEYMNKQHETAIQKAHDLEELKRQELEYQQFQKMLVEDNSKFQNMKKNLEMTISPGSDSASKSKSASKPLSKSVSKVVSKKYHEPHVNTDSDTSRSTLSNISSKSSRSVISINKTLKTKLDQNKNSIKPSSISFGSTTKGRKGGITSGKN